MAPFSPCWRVLWSIYYSYLNKLNKCMRFMKRNHPQYSFGVQMNILWTRLVKVQKPNECDHDRRWLSTILLVMAKPCLLSTYHNTPKTSGFLHKGMYLICPWFSYAQTLLDMDKKSDPYFGYYGKICPLNSCNTFVLFLMYDLYQSIL